MIGYAVWEYIDITQAETTGQSGYTRLRGSSQTLYMIFGKWGVVVGTVVVGLAAIAIGGWQFKKQHEE